MDKLFEENGRTKVAVDMNSSMLDLMDPALNSRFKIQNLPKQTEPKNPNEPALPKLEIQSNTNPEKKTQRSAKDDLPTIYRPPLFEDTGAPPEKSEAQPELSEDQKPDRAPKKQTNFEPPKRREQTATETPTFPILPPLTVPVEGAPANSPTNKSAAHKDWFPTPHIEPLPEPKVWPKTLTPIVPRDYSGDRRNASPAPSDTAGAAYWRGKSISDPELISKGILELSYVREVMSRHPDAVLIGENGNIRYMNANGEFTLKPNVPLWLPRAAGLAFLRAQEEATRNGMPIQPENDPGSYNPAGRTNSQQQSAVRTARIAARVGASRHQGPGAMDIKNWKHPVVQRALRNNGWQHGDGRGPIANDYHHWSYAGG